MPDTVPADLQQAWDTLPDIGGETTPAFYDAHEHVLYVHCLSEEWREHLLGLGPSLLEQLKAALPERALQTIRFGLRPTRLLVTGSRDWDDEQTVWDALLNAWHDATQLYGPEHRFIVVHGACGKGADWMAHRWAMMHRFQGDRVDFEPHPADWKTHGNYAGPLRNQAMVDLGADLCLAFIKNNSRGASHTVERAAAAGIPVRRFTA